MKNLNDYEHVMMDLETLSTAKNAAIIEIGLVRFNLNGEIEDAIKIPVNPMSSIRYGLDVQSETLGWWAGQDEKVQRKVLVNSFSKGLDLKDALIQMNQFLSTSKKVYLWGNGVFSDNVWIDNAMESCGLKPAYTFRSHMCVRTIATLFKGLLARDFKKEIEFAGSQHDSIDDAKHQIKYLTRYIKEVFKVQGE